MGKTWDILPSVGFWGSKREAIDDDDRVRVYELGELFVSWAEANRREGTTGDGKETRKCSCELCTEDPAQNSTSGSDCRGRR